ncbi:hypothetical protein ACB092_11G013000 [Castanea dentata]
MGEPSSSGLSKSERVPGEFKPDSFYKTPVEPPKAKEEYHKMEMFKDVRYDSYNWFRNGGKKFAVHLKDENKYFCYKMSDYEKIRRDLYEEMKRWEEKEDYGDEFAAVRRPNYHYHRRVLTAKTAEAYNNRAPILDSLDITSEDPYYGRLKAEAKDKKGDGIYDINIRNAQTGIILETIEGVTSNFEWAGVALVYIAMDKENRRSYEVYLHNLRTKQASDKCLYHEEDDKFSLYVHASEDKKFLFVTSESKTTSFNYYLDVSKPEDGLKAVTRREEGIDTSVSRRGNHFFILRRTDEFFNSEVVACPVACPLDKTAETIVLSHRESVKIQNIQLYEDHLVVHELVNGLPKVTIYGLPDVGEPVQSLQGGFTVLFDDDPTYSAEPLVSEFNSSWLLIRYSTLKTPPFVYKVDMKTGKVVRKESATVLQGFDASNYVIERKWANALDGTQIPISIVYRKDLVKLNGSAPLLLTGYGSYEELVDPSFESSRLCLLDQGFIYAIAHIRGGGEMGRQWYENGKLLNKKNTFTDFIACAEYLIENKYCSKEQLSIIGASAGGLLICGVLNMRPDLFKAAVAEAPFVDVLTTMLDPTIPLTTLEWEEWGDPREEDFYHYMKSYSPVDNIHVLCVQNLLSL